MPDRDKDALAARNRQTQLTVRVPADLKRWVRGVAEADGKNVSAYVTAVLEEKRQQRCPAPAATGPAGSRAGAVMAEVTWSEREMSNFDRTVDPCMEEDLRAGMWGCHNARNFHGEVRYDPDEGVFKEEVSVYGAVRGTLSAPTLEELMRVVNDEYGWD